MRNTLLFILAGTLINILLMAGCFLLFLVIYSVFLHSRIGDGAMAWVLTIIFLAALAVSLIIYQRVIKIIMRKINNRQISNG